MDCRHIILTMPKKTHVPRTVTAAEVDAEHVLERRAMLAQGARCNFGGRREGDGYGWRIDFAALARETQTGKVGGVPTLVRRVGINNDK